MTSSANAAANAPSYSDLMRLGRVHAMARVPEQSRQSLPVPVRTNGKLQVAFFFAPAQILPGLNRLAPPHFIVWLDPANGNLIDVKEVTPQDFGQSHGAKDMIGEYRLPEGLTADAYVLERERLFGLYGNLVPLWMSGTEGDAAARRILAQEFLRLFGVVSEPPLIPYYHALGRPFFDWVRAAARA